MSVMSDLDIQYQMIIAEYQEHKDKKKIERLIWKTFAPIHLDLAETLLERYRNDAALEISNGISSYEQLQNRQKQMGYLV